MTSKSPRDSLEGTLASDQGILSLGFLRTGSYSMFAALKILGYTRVGHAVDMAMEGTSVDWGRPAWATLPYIHTQLYPNRLPPWLDLPEPTEFTREDWDDACGRRYEVMTDIGAMFAPSLIEAYPHAKVILVERDLESWAQSFDAVMVTALLSTPVAKWSRWLSRWVLGNLEPQRIRDQMLGFMRVPDEVEMRKVMRDRYREHYVTVRRMVPADRLLEYSLGDGWEPLCAFLGKPIPNVPFPRANERESLMKLISIGHKRTLMAAALRVGKYALLVATVCMAIAKRGSLMRCLYMA